MNLRKIKGGASVDSLTLIAVKLLTMLSSMVIVKILSVKLSLTEYGAYSAIMVVVNMGVNIAILGLLDATNYFFNQTTDREKREQNIATTLLVELVVAGMFAILTVLFRSQISAYFKMPSIGSAIIIAAWIPLFMNGISIYQILYVAVKKAKLISLFSLAATLVKLIYVSIIASTTKNITFIFSCMLVAEIVQLLLMIVIFMKKSGYELRFRIASKALAIDILKYAIPMGTYIWINTLTKETDKLIIGRLAGPESLAMYTNAAKQLPFDILTASFITVLIPYITRFLASNKSEDAAHALSRYFQISMIGVWGLALGVFLRPEGLITILYSEQYTRTKVIFLIYIVVDMVRILQTSILFSATNNSKLLLRYAAIVCVGNIGLDILLYYQMGIVGPAVATLIVNLIHASYMIWKGAKIIGVPVAKLLEPVNAVRQLGKLAVPMACGFLFRIVIGQFGMNVIVEFILIYAVYLLLVFVFNYKSALNLIKEINHLKLV